MILAAAQTKPKRWNILENLQDHCRLIEVAADHGAALVVFPEMSISGYERLHADSMSFTPQDSRIDELIKLSADKKIIIVAGAPIKINSNLHIGEFIIRPEGSVLIYTKQFLHPGEEEYFKSSFEHHPLVTIGNENISFAICADIDNPMHPENASKMGSSIYIPSIFFSPKGIPSAHSALSHYARKYKMNILMSNFSGESWGQASGGRSAFWNNKGELIAEMNDGDSGLLIVEKEKDGWKGRILNNK